ncbi:hypothetical protein AAFF_G00427160 [Aldrovandia affinis]|uniref:Uncharacterized protein n=1 Tax=Aldrovandia affinis TaxID=143900 RepID=A0AAD7S9E0_9TELE|nr:hypothetical protein AAFF_G00427160 [Aldrovandia affinis]
MRRLPQRLLSLCLTGALLLPLCQGNDDEYVYDSDTTATPDYDYNATFDYMYYSNASQVDYRDFDIQIPGNEDTKDTMNNKAPETGLPSLLLMLSLSVHKFCQLL